MRYAVIADIHSNLEALTAVFGEIRKQRVDRILCLGDLVGYGASPKGTIEILMQESIEAISGNHDRYLSGRTPIAAEMREETYLAVEWTRKTITPEQMDFLDSLPNEKLIGENLLIVHGSPRHQDEYLLSWETFEDNFLHLRTNRPGVHICFFGHTHIPILATPTMVEARFDKKESFSTFQLVSSKAYLVNPGSVGQPRDRCNQAAFAIYDDREDVLSFLRVPYDIGSAQRRIQEAGLGRWLARRLEMGR